MADLNAKPKRVARTSKRVPVAVPFMPDVQVATDKPLPDIIEQIAHLPIDTPSASNVTPEALTDTRSDPIDPPVAAMNDADVADPSDDAGAHSVVPEPIAFEALATESNPNQTTAAATAPHVQEDNSMTDTMQNTAETMQANTRDAMSKGKQAFEDMTAFGQGNVEAMVESTRVAVKGVEAMAQARTAFAKQSFGAAVQTLKSMSEVRSPADFFKLQGEYLRSSMDALVAETSRSTEATLKLVGEIAQPIQNRVALAAEKVRSAA